MNIDEEIWKNVSMFNGLYKVSNLGRVCRFHKHTPPRILQPHLNTHGYVQVCLSKGEVRKFCTVHRLVATAFIPNPQNKDQINHIDGNKLNNSVNNLEWCTAKENIQHAITVLHKHSSLGLSLTGNRNPLKGKNNPKSKPVFQIKNGIIIAEFESTNEAFRQTGIRHIFECCNGHKQYSHAGGYQWKHKN